MTMKKNQFQDFV